MAKSELRIDILGTEISITTDEEPGYLKKLLAKYRQTIENVRQKSGLKDPLKVAVLTGFLLCDDLEKAGIRDAKNNAPGEAEELTMGIISRLDEALKVSEPEETYTVPVSAKASETTPQDTTVSARVVPGSAAPVQIYKLENTVKNYDWGSPEWLPAFLGQKNLSRIPWAELWMGVNPSGPSRVVPLSRPLSEVIAGNPEAFLGKETAGKYGTLPFLLKIIAAAKPLSIQVHPNAEQARQGFERENREGIPLGAPNRNYKDPNQKNEILCALGPFAALCGFRKTEEITLLMDILLLNSGAEGSGLREIITDLVMALKQDQGEYPDGRPRENSLKNFLSALFALEREKLLALGSFIKLSQTQFHKDFPEYVDEWHLCSYLTALHPGDPGILAPLYLNILELAPEEAISIPAGTPHAYINGMGIELLSDSDNVLRGGLTSKHVDHAELMKIMNYSEFIPNIMRPPAKTRPSGLSATSLPSANSLPTVSHIYPAGDFALSIMRGSGTERPYAESGPSILIITEGSAVVNEDGAEMPLKKGESVFIPAGKMALFSGTFTAYAATCRF
jgi:mannose-6-phosphate isomerase